MNPSFKQNKAAPDKEAPGQTPFWLRRTLISLLVFSAFAGFFLNGLEISHFFSAGFRPPDRSAEETPGGFPDWMSRVEKSMARPKAEADNGILFQGIMTGGGGRALAIINGQAFAAGAQIHGVSVIEITASNVLVECDGETRLLKPGNSFVPGK